MNDYHEKLTNLLLDKNDYLSYAQARIWVELLWDDFETTFVRAGVESLGSETTELVVKQWIEQYGGHLHEFAGENLKYKGYFEQDKNTLH
ncbi:YfhJ family protein [Neobacillus sp. PS3-40]|uniref:YfhJ family protein n=1 Tax=Neobacillus sp. PS3-40 TaxID=3070679 RepID=UPI0027E0A69B|nr:YfhJ family protein [Neobacillus sp. PS3-40]WML43063.1 YfhJ family protein [Neobacillus sp. PS3-40]